jgi:hypothetical protein
MKEGKDDLNLGSQASQPTNIFHLLPLLPFFAPAFGSVAGQGTEALLKHVQSPDAVFVQVLDSKQVDDKHQVQFKVTNHTLHGVYIESAVLAEPGENSTITDQQKAESRSISDSFVKDHAVTGRSRVPPFPKLLHSGNAMLFNVEFPLGDKERKMKPDSAGRLELMISRLDQSKSEKKQAKFLIRWSTI